MLKNLDVKVTLNYCLIEIKSELDPNAETYELISLYTSLKIRSLVVYLMNTLVYLFVASGLAIIIGTFLMYNLESRAENTQMKTLLDALWWCIATVTTVGYGDVVPVTSLGRIMAIIYMFFGITLIAVLLAVISNNFYRKRIEKQESEKKEQETNYLRNLIMKRLSDIELKQSECIELVNQLNSSMENSNKHKNS